MATKTLAIAALAAIITTGAAHAQWNVTTTPMGNGWSTHEATGPHGQSATGSTVPMGHGWSTTDWTDNRGHSWTCSTMPMGHGFSTTDCH